MIKLYHETFSVFEAVYLDRETIHIYDCHSLLNFVSICPKNPDLSIATYAYHTRMYVAMLNP